AVELVLDHVEQLTVQPLHQIEGFQIVLAQRLRAFERRRRLRFGQCRHRFTPACAGPTLLSDEPRSDGLRRRKISQRMPRNISMMPEKSVFARPWFANSE